MKYYAVRVGKKTGIFGTWDECKEAVLGYPKAEYKSFKSYEDAENYLNGSHEEIVGDVVIYNLHDKVCEVSLTGKTYTGNCTLEAELNAICGVVTDLAEDGRKQITIIYKNDGCLNWYSGSWQAKSEISISYSSRLHQLESEYGLELHFKKVG